MVVVAVVVRMVRMMTVVAAVVAVIHFNVGPHFLGTNRKSMSRLVTRGQVKDKGAAFR